jgi:hypothetical protein
LSLAFSNIEGEIENPFGLLVFLSQLIQAFHLISMLLKKS